MTEPYNWSPAMAAIRKAHVLDPVHDDPRTNRAQNLPFGYPLSRIRTAVLEWGLADFRTPANLSGGEPLSPEDKVLLDCYVNMRRHFFACTAAYEAFEPAIRAILGATERPLVIDVGCGPATAGLALADRFPGHDFEYLGIDVAPAMREKAQSLWEAARAGGLVATGAPAAFHASWEEVDVAAVAPGRPVLVLFSYFFTSRSLGPAAVRSLTEFVQALAAGRSTDVAVVYVNPPGEPAAAKYHVFAQGLGFDHKAFPPTPKTVEFRTLGGEPPGKEEFVYDLFYVMGTDAGPPQGDAP